MGVGYQGLQFSLFAKRKGVDFRKTILLGRQHHFLDAGTLRAMFARFGESLKEEAVQRILAEPYAEGLFQTLGAEQVDSLDASDYEGANLLHDLNQPIPEKWHQRYSCVVDFGSLEHVFNFPMGLKNAIDLLEEGGHFLSATTANNFMGHGFYQFSPELFFNYLPNNGFSTVEVYMLLFRNVPYFFRVRSPQELKSRVELVNHEPVLMGVLAQKQEHRASVVFPIQSDYQNQFWQGQDVDRKVEAPPVDAQLAANMQTFRQKLAELTAWPESISPHFVNGFENHRVYQWMDPAIETGARPMRSVQALLSKLQRAAQRLSSPSADPELIRALGASPSAVDFVEHRGVIIPIVPGVFSDQIAQAVRQGTYEASEVGELDALIQPDEVVLEIGAGCGFLSTYCAKHPHTKAVHAVEANPKLIELIKLTHEVNEVEVHLYHEILGKEAGETDFYVHEDFWASGTHSFLGKPIKVKTTPFQQRLNEIRPTLLIVDIEGGEETLFEGVDLTGVQKILLEVHQPTIGRRGVQRLFDCLSAQGFHYDMWHSCRSIVTFSHVDRG